MKILLFGMPFKKNMENKDSLIAGDFNNVSKGKNNCVPGTQRTTSPPLCDSGINGIHKKGGKQEIGDVLLSTSRSQV